ncbi:MAG TPA: dihydroneopterin aldolase [Gammaproteobacteria bacterium]|nr:dihydroneopterin aldolase [Gammaproteobacteria bacterium]
MPKDQIDTISINQLQVDCIIGVLPEERIQPQPLLISLDIETDFSSAVQHDDIANTLDYNLLSTIISNMAIKGKFHLIETLAENIAQYILSLPKVFKTKITLQKPQALANAKSAAVTIQRSNDTHDSNSP